MDEPYQEKHGAFLLKCEPRQDASGGYRPRLIAIRMDRTGYQETDVLLPESPVFMVATAAAEFALTFGKRWVRERLLPPSPDK